MQWRPEKVQKGGDSQEEKEATSGVPVYEGMQKKQTDAVKQKKRYEKRGRGALESLP